MKLELKRSHVKIVVALLIVALISSTITYSYAQSGGSSTFTISSGVYPGSPSYTIYVEDGTYKAKTLMAQSVGPQQILQHL